MSRYDGGFWFRDGIESYFEVVVRVVDAKSDTPEYVQQEERKTRVIATVGDTVAQFMLEHSAVWDKIKDDIVLRYNKDVLYEVALEYDEMREECVSQAHRTFMSYLVDANLRGCEACIDMDNDTHYFNVYGEYDYDFGQRPQITLVRL